VIDIGPIREKVHIAESTSGAQLHAVDAYKAFRGKGLPETRGACIRVMIGQCGKYNPLRRQIFGQRCGVQLAVAERRVGVKIYLGHSAVFVITRLPDHHASCRACSGARPRREQES